MAPSVSIVIPIYNAAPWIDSTLASVRELQYEPALLELIVVDDGSTDDGPRLVAAALADWPWQAELLTVANGGPSRARNLGWRRATGEWVQFLDADDLLTSTKLAVQLGAAPVAPPELAVRYSDWQRRPADQPELDVSLRRPQVDADPQTALMQVGGENFIQVGAALFRRGWLERVGGFDEGRWLIEDVDLMLRIAFAGGSFQRVPSARPLFTQRQTAGSLSQRDERAFFVGCLHNTRTAEHSWRAAGALTAERRHLLADNYCFSARYFAAADPAEFARLAAAIEQLVPGYLPPGPPLLRTLARLIGYRRAEPLTVLYRRTKRAANLGSR